jgi:hypothetical protein
LDQEMIPTDKIHAVFWEWVSSHKTGLLLLRVGCYKERPPHVVSLFSLLLVPFLLLCHVVTKPEYVVQN